MSNSLTKKAFSGFLWTFIGRGGQFGLRILILMVLSRLLSPSDFGLIASATVVIGLMEIIARLGIGPALIQIDQVSEKHVHTALTIALLSGLIFCFIVFLMAPLFAEFFATSELKLLLRVFSFSIIIVNVGIVSEALMTRRLQFRLLSIIHIVSYFIGYGILGIITSILGLKYWALAVAFMSQILLNSLFVLFIVFPGWPKFCLNSAGQLLRFGTPLTLAKLANFFALQGDYVVVGRMLGMNFLGYYTRAYQLMGLPTNLVGQAVETVLFPTMSKLQNEPNKIKDAEQRLVGSYMILFFPLAFYMFISAPELVQLILGPSWAAVVLPFRLLALAIFFRVAYKVDTTILNALGRVRSVLYIQCTYAGCVLTSTFVGSKYGLNGVALGVLFSILVVYAITHIVVCGELRLSLKDTLNTHLRPIFPIMFIGFVIWVSIFVSRNLFRIPVFIVGFSIAEIFFILYFIWYVRPTVYGKDAAWLINQFAPTFRRTIGLRRTFRNKK